MWLYSKSGNFFNGAVHLSISQVTHKDPTLTSHPAQNYFPPSTQLAKPEMLSHPWLLPLPPPQPRLVLPSKSFMNPSGSSSPLPVPLSSTFPQRLLGLQENLLATSLPGVSPSNPPYTQQPGWSLQNKNVPIWSSGNLEMASHCLN